MTAKRRIRWKRACDGFIESHDGRWRITPCYAGCTRPQDYELWHDGERVGSTIATQHDAKLMANEPGQQQPHTRRR